MMYLCETCGAAFDQPFVRKMLVFLGDTAQPYREELCPICGEPYFYAADLCQCGATKRAKAPLCQSCKRSMIARSCDFLDTLTAGEESALDELLDGCSVSDHNAWRTL